MLLVASSQALGELAAAGLGGAAEVEQDDVETQLSAGMGPQPG